MAKKDSPVKLEFDLSTTAKAEEIVAHLKQLKTTTGWLFLEHLLEAQMEVLQKAVMTRRDPQTGEKLSEEERNIAGDRYLIYEELVNKPDQLINQLSEHSNPETPEYDPYQVDIKQESKDIPTAAM